MPLQSNTNTIPYHTTTLHYTTLHCIALHYITLHYMHTYIFCSSWADTSFILIETIHLWWPLHNSRQQATAADRTSSRHFRFFVLSSSLTSCMVSSRLNLQTICYTPNTHRFTSNVTSNTLNKLASYVNMESFLIRLLLTLGHVNVNFLKPFNLPSKPFTVYLLSKPGPAMQNLTALKQPARIRPPRPAPAPRSDPPWRRFSYEKNGCKNPVLSPKLSISEIYYQKISDLSSTWHFNFDVSLVCVCVIYFASCFCEVLLAVSFDAWHYESVL